MCGLFCQHANTLFSDTLPVQTVKLSLRTAPRQSDRSGEVHFQTGEAVGGGGCRGRSRAPGWAPSEAGSCPHRQYKWLEGPLLSSREGIRAYVSGGPQGGFTLGAGIMVSTHSVVHAALDNYPGTVCTTELTSHLCLPGQQMFPGTFFTLPCESTAPGVGWPAFKSQIHCLSAV